MLEGKRIAILAEEGFEYDSSIFPIRHDRYGMPDSPRFPYRLKSPKNYTIIEFPLSTLRIFGFNMPVSGGGYFRLYPYQFTQYALNKINKGQKPFVFYLHPWEIDPKQPRVAESSLLCKYRHYTHLGSTLPKLSRLIAEFQLHRFITCSHFIGESCFDSQNLYKAA